MKKWTNASELARLAGISRERVSQILASGGLPGVRVLIGLRSAWRIDTRDADKWLKGRDLSAPKWVKRENAVGAMEDVWVGG